MVRFFNKMGRPVVHASFDVLKTTGRTSSFGEINLQNLPRDDRIRSCFVPSPGHVFISADYKTLEMATLAQVMITQFGTESQMATLINEGRDLHRAMACGVTPKSATAWTWSLARLPRSPKRGSRPSRDARIPVA